MQRDGSGIHFIFNLEIYAAQASKVEHCSPFIKMNIAL